MHSMYFFSNSKSSNSVYPTQQESTVQRHIFLIVQWRAEIPGIGSMLYLLSLYSLLEAWASERHQGFGAILYVRWVKECSRSTTRPGLAVQFPHRMNGQCMTMISRLIIPCAAQRALYYKNDSCVQSLKTKQHPAVFRQCLRMKCSLHGI